MGNEDILVTGSEESFSLSALYKKKLSRATLWSIIFKIDQYVHSLTETLVREVWARLDQGERMYDPRYDFSDNSVISVTLILETWLKVMAHILPKCML